MVLKANKKLDSYIFPVLPIRNIVFFPKTYLIICAVRRLSINAINASINYSKKNNEEEIKADFEALGLNDDNYKFDNLNRVILVSQKDGNIDSPTPNSLFSVGVLSKITQITKLLDDSYMLSLEGLERVKISKWLDNVEYLSALVEPIQTINTEKNQEICEANFKVLVSSFQDYASFNNRYSQELLDVINVSGDQEKIVNVIAANMPIKTSLKQKILEEPDLSVQTSILLNQITHETYIAEIEERIRNKVRKQVEQSQKDVLKDQLHALQREINLGSADDEITALEKKLKESKLSEEAIKQVNHELNRLKSMSPMSSEALVSKLYLQCISEIPWGIHNELNNNIKFAKEILDKKCFGLEKVKREIYKTIALYSRSSKAQGKILCFLGPPGTGKTSLAKLIAEATGRGFYRISLGGMKDEAELRGHRRTYIGSMPGKIINALRATKSMNPVILLDEISRTSKDYKGDPESALLEILDPEQNTTFRDNYVDLPVNLQDVFFIATTNTLDMAKPLIDRLKIIEIPGYTVSEKKSIAQDYIIPTMMEKYKLSNDDFYLNPECLTNLIRFFTKQEMGVRGLTQSIEDICAEAALRIEEAKADNKSFDKAVIANDTEIRNFLSRPRYPEQSQYSEDQVGISNGLGWTEDGGLILRVETITLSCKEQPSITGNLEKVMQESVIICKSFIIHKAKEYGLNPKFFDENTISTNFWEAGLKKDGPSGGIAIFCSMLSAMTNKKLKYDVAMTGEITLAGEVLPVGGLKEKLLAAYYNKMLTVLLPKQNEDILQDLPKEVTENIKLIFVSKVDEVIDCAFAEDPRINPSTLAS